MLTAQRINNTNQVMIYLAEQAPPRLYTALSQFLVEVLARDSADQLSFTKVKDLLDSSPLTISDVAPYILESSSSYTRNRILRGVNFELLVLTWLSGQRSPIHDHADSVCGIKVLEGEAHEVRYASSAQTGLKPIGEDHFVCGQTTCSFGDDIHYVENRGPGRLVTLHLYAPALDTMRIYEEQI